MRALALALLLASCAQAPAPREQGPVEAVQAFAAALQRRNVDAAFALLSARTQKAADAGAPALSGKAMLFGGAQPAGELTARELSRQGDVAEVEVSSASGKRVYRLVREAGGFRIDLDLPPG